MNLAAIVVTLMALEIAGFVMSVTGEGAAEAGTYMFWIGALAFTAVVVTTLLLLV